jgi:nucleotide-binding universal stress UspA family protein
MKTILILSDFSENSTHAALSGVMLSKKLHANILLFNSNVTRQVLPQYSGGPTVMDEFNFFEKQSKESLLKISESLGPLLGQSGSDWKPSVNTLSGIGGLGPQLDDIIREKDIEMVVMGARAGSAIDHILTGSETYAVIDRSSRPVLIIPLNSGLDHIRRVVFATNFIEEDIKAIHYLIGLGHVFNFQLDIVHVNPVDDTDITKSLREAEIVKHIHRQKYAHIHVVEIRGKDVIERLNRLCKESNADLLSFTHYNESFLSRLFKQSTTKEALSAQTTPLLIFPPNME